MAAANFTAVIFLLVLAVTTFFILRNRNFGPDSDIKLILYGVVLESLAWATHRTYWGIWRIAREYSWEGWNEWFITHGYLAVAPSFLVLSGLGLILSPLWKTCVIPWNNEARTVNYLIPVGLIIGTYLLLFAMIDDEDQKHKLNLPAPQITVPVQQ